MWDPREPPTWWILGLLMVLLGALTYLSQSVPAWTPWIPLALGFLFFLVGARVRRRH